MMTNAKANASMSVETARELLRHVMEWHSEDSYCAGWISNNEYDLWCQVARDPVVAGELFDLPMYRWLRELAAIAEGWWVWPHENRQSPSPGPLFVGMSEWLPMYEEHRQKVIEKYGPKGWEAGLPRAREESRAFWEAVRAEREGAGVAAKPKGLDRETAVALLLRLMDDESEVNGATSWEHDHEYMLWKSVADGGPSRRRGDSSEADRLRDLATAANGWFTWSKEAKEVEFVPMGRWLVMYREFVAAHPPEPPEEGPSE